MTVALSRTLLSVAQTIGYTTRTNPTLLSRIGTFPIPYDEQAKMHAISRFSSAVKKEECLSSIIHQEIEKNFPVHPFSQGVTGWNAKEVLSKYLAMSQAFPLIQAGAFAPLILKSMQENKELAESFFRAFAVGMFLCNDEMGSHWILINGGNARLPEILQTDTQSHASLLKKDIRTLFKNPVAPDYSPATTEYLKKLMESLGSDQIENLVATMVAFENHAHVMIESLWERLAHIYPGTDKDALEYFKIHVGGDDPAEAYHTKMTEGLILHTKANANLPKFLDLVLKNYERNHAWCQKICEESNAFTRIATGKNQLQEYLCQ